MTIPHRVSAIIGTTIHSTSHPLDTHNLFNMLDSLSITPRPHFASPCIPAPTSRIIHDPLPLPHPCAPPSRFYAPCALKHPTPHFDTPLHRCASYSAFFTRHRTLEHPIPHFRTPTAHLSIQSRVFMHHRIISHLYAPLAVRHEATCTTLG